MGEHQTTPNSTPVVRRKKWLRISRSACILGVISVAGWLVFCWSGKSSARAHLEDHRPGDAHADLKRYLRILPLDAEANLMMAEAVVMAELQEPPLAARQAIDHLRRIPDSSALAAEARMREGRLRFLILGEVEQAEHQFRRAIQINPDDFDSHYLLWQVLNMTERYDRSEQQFWEVFRLTPESDQPIRLREWYLSQFYPRVSTEVLDRMMGFLAPEELPSGLTLQSRLQSFRTSEPDSVTSATAMAAWCLRERMYDLSLDVLDQIDINPSVLQDDFYLAIRIEVLLKRGEFDEADRLFSSWSSLSEDYHYSRIEGMILELVHADNEGAVAAYNRALDIWPGQVDWQTMHRKAQCLARSGDRESADLVRERAKQIELLVEPDVHARLRTALARLTDPESLMEVENFYRSIDRPREADCWRDVRERQASRINDGNQSFGGLRVF